MNPSPPYKALMMLETTVGGTPVGWTESLWIGKPSFDLSLEAAKEVCQRRLALLPPCCRLRMVRVTNPSLPRSSMIHQYETYGSYGTEWGRSPGACLLLRFAFQGYHTIFRLDGLPKGVLHDLDEAPEAWRNAFQDYCTVVMANCVIVNKKHTAEGDSDETVVNPIESITPQRLSLRKRGRLFFLTRGRKR